MWLELLLIVLAIVALRAITTGRWTTIDWAMRLTFGKKTRRPDVHGGVSARAQAILDAVPTLKRNPRAFGSLPGMVQLAISFVEMQWQESSFDKDYDVVTEEVPVTLPGKSAVAHADIVRLRWLRHHGASEPAADAPIVVICPGLSCYAASLPGTSIYPGLLAKGYRVVAFEKRGVGPAGTPAIKAPIIHVFGHPSDLHTAMLIIQSRYPRAPIHIVGLSSGNGLAGSYTSMYAGEVENLRSALLLVGGEDYNEAFRPPKGGLMSRLLFDMFLLPAAKSRFGHRNKAVLQNHSKAGYEDMMAANTLQEFYERTMLHFSGYSDREEAERRINGFSGSNECLLKVQVPFLVVFTEDDPVAPGGPKPSWVQVVSKCERAALALFPSGSHLACYDGWRLRKWTDRLAVEWIEACEVDGGRCRIPYDRKKAKVDY